jgi:hypothetical protein
MAIDLDRGFQYYTQAASMAVDISGEARLPEHLGLSKGGETRVLNFSLAQRLLRTAIYNIHWLTNLPGIDTVAEIPLIGGSAAGVLQRKRQSLVYLREASDKVEESLQEKRGIFVQRGTPRLPRVIELAANDLTARSSVTRWDDSINLEIHPQFVAEWGEVWGPRVEAARIPEPS